MALRKIRARYRTFGGTPWYHGGRDNKDYFNSRGGAVYNRNSIRVPSLNASSKTWNNFYKLFPNIKRFLMGDTTALCGTFRETEFDERGNVFVVRKEQRVGNRFGIRTFKYKKTW